MGDLGNFSSILLLVVAQCSDSDSDSDDTIVPNRGLVIDGLGPKEATFLICERERDAPSSLCCIYPRTGVAGGVAGRSQHQCL
jgi:hypothetical protein